MQQQRAPDSVFRDLADRMRELRKAQKLTQRQIAERLGCGVRQVQRLEAGEANPPLTELVALAWALGVDVRELLMPPDKRLPRRPGRPTSG